MSAWLVYAFLFFTATAIASSSPADDAKITTSNAGNIKGDFRVTPTGQAHYSIPIDAPPGTAGLAPALSIVYDSSSSNTKNGLLGMGFSLEGLTAITRCPSNKTQNGLIHGVDFTDQDRFCLNGEQLVAIKGAYGADGAEYRTYIDSKVKIISYGRQGNGPASFKVWTKGGQIAEYGIASDSQVKAQGKDTVVFYGLNRIQDTAGNYLDVHYFKDEGQGSFYPTEVNYTGNEKAKLAPCNSIKFIYEERPDTKTTYQAGSKIILDKRLKTIQVYQKSTPVHEYRLLYEISKNTFRSCMTSIQKCSGSGACLPPTKFAWQTNEEGWVEAPNFILPVDASISGKDDGVRILDVNGDGLPDIVQGSDKKPHKTWINTGKGWFDNPNFVLPTNILMGGEDTGVRLLDVNGDGLPDIIQGSDKIPHKTWLNTGESWAVVDAINFISPLDILVEGKDDGVRFLDLNGDGLPDIVQVTPVEEIIWKDAEGAHTSKFDFVNVFQEAEKRGEYNRSQRGWTVIYGVEDSAFVYKGGKFDPDRKSYATWINTKNGWARNFTIDVSSPVSRTAPYGRGSILLDLNGDGQTDFICGTSIGNNEQRKTWMNTGADGWKDSSFTLPANMLSNGRDTGLKFLDLNGDGLPDIIQSYVDNSSKKEAREAWLNTGNGWNKSSGFILPTNIVENGQDAGVSLLDLNGDGLPDVLQSYIDANKKEAHEAWLNSGKGWVSTLSFNLPQNITSGIQYLDLNGDGLPDFIQSTSLAYLNKAQKLPDYLISVTDGFGAKITIDYEPLSGKKVDVYTKEHDAQYPNMDWQGPMYVVYEIASETAGIVANKTNYYYTGAKFNHLGLGFLGFHKVTSTDQSTGVNTTTTYNQDIDSFTKGFPVATETRLTNGALISSSKDIWNCKIFGADNVDTTYYSPYLAQSIKKTYGLDGVLISTTTINNNIDKYGNPRRIISSVQEAATQKTHTTTTINAYHDDPKKWTLGELMATKVTETVSDQSEQAGYALKNYSLVPTVATAGPGSYELVLQTTTKKATKTSNVTTKSEGEDLVMRAICQIHDGLIDKSAFIIKDPPYMGARVVGETKAIGIYLFSSAIHSTDNPGNKDLMERTTDMAVKELVKMREFINQGKTQIFLQESISKGDEAVYMALTFSSSAFFPEDCDFIKQTVDLIGDGLIDKDAFIAEDGASLLIWASLIGYIETVKDLLKAGANPNKARESDGKTALLVASLNGDDEIVEMLLESGAVVDFTGEDGNPALILASQKGYSEVVKILLEKGATVDLTDKDGWTALMWASQKGYDEVVKILLEKGAVVDRVNNKKMTALMLASSRGHAEVVKMLLENGAAVDFADENGRTALMFAAQKGQDEVIKVFVKNDKRMAALLASLSAPAEAEAIKMIREKGATVDLADGDGWAAIIFAHFGWNAGTEEGLIEKGTDPGLDDKSDADIYVISYPPNPVLPQEKISGILSNKVICWDGAIYSNNKIEQGCGD